MGDLNNIPKSSPFLPPGCRFYPSEQQLLCFYLAIKNNKNPNTSSSLSNPIFLSFDLIQEFDLYNNDPCDLPEVASFPFGRGGRKKHWYLFTVRVSSEGLKRKGKGGFWKRKGSVRNVLGGKDAVVMGTKTTFVFYRRESARPGCCKTNWFMIEYALVDHRKDSFVLCRVFLKPCSGNKTVAVVRNSYVDKSIAAKQNISVEIPNKKLDVASGSDFLIKSSTELDDKVVARPNSDYDIGSFWDNHNLDETVKSSSGFIGGYGTLEDIMADEQRVNSIILAGDFIELNDLVGPLVCPFSTG